MTGLTSPLIHTWSLAVEEQFYLVWPLVFLAVLKLTRSLRVLLVVAVVGAIASATEMALLYNPTNINRLYFGTDTHAQSVLVGATLALGLALWADRNRQGDEQDWQARTPRGRGVLTVIGLVGLVVSGILCTSVHSDDPFVYRGGFLLAAIAWAGVLLSVSCAQTSLVARMLSFPLFTFVGRISYGMYLWHFPLFIFINEQRTGLSGWSLYVVRVIPTVGVALLSFYPRRTADPAGHLLHLVPSTQSSPLPPSGSSSWPSCWPRCPRPTRSPWEPPPPGRSPRRPSPPQSPPPTPRRRPVCSWSATPRHSHSASAWRPP